MTSTATRKPVAQVSFPGQAAAAAGPCDLLPMFLMHYGFRRDLIQFAAAAANTPVADRSAWRRLAKRWDKFGTVLHGHHTGEDEILWPLLLSKVDGAGDSEARQTLDAMEAEHSEIDPLLAGCAAGFHRLAEAADADARAALVVRLAATQQRLGDHLGHEESDAMVILQRHLTAAEWDGMHGEFGKHYKGVLVFTASWVTHQVPANLMPQVSAFMGTPVMLVSRVLRPWFDRQERRTFGRAYRMLPS